MIRALLDVLFPQRCVACGTGTWPTCPGCRPGVAVLSPPGCTRCGRPLESSVSACVDCPPGTIAWCRAPFLYEGPVRRALFRLKFSGLRSSADAFAHPMFQALSGSPPWSGFPNVAGEDSVVLTWVPLGRRRRRSRGFDQAEALARAVGRATGLPVRRLLERTVETSPQARRSGSDRRRALAGAFRVAGPIPPGVVLIDDVLTSGATAAECAGALRLAGAAWVGVLTAARALGGPLPARCYNPLGLQPGSVVARETFSR